MRLTLEQQLFENFQKLDDATKHQLIARMQQALVAPVSLDLATWQAQTHALRMRMHPITDVVDVLDSVRNEHTSS
jgi:hypothetical protein